MTQRPLADRLAFLCLWLFVFSMPIEKAIEIPGLGSITKLLGFVALGMGGLAVLMRERLCSLVLRHAALEYAARRHD
jgi:hypothetical protein